MKGDLLGRVNIQFVSSFYSYIYSSKLFKGCQIYIYITYLMQMTRKDRTHHLH